MRTETLQTTLPIPVQTNIFHVIFLSVSSIHIIIKLQSFYYSYFHLWALPNRLLLKYNTIHMLYCSSASSSHLYIYNLQKSVCSHKFARHSSEFTNIIHIFIVKLCSVKLLVIILMQQYFMLKTKCSTCYLKPYAAYF